MSTHSQDPDTLGDRLRRARGQAKLTQSEVGEHLEISKSAVSQWETNLWRPSTDKMKRLAMLYQVSLDWIYGNEVIERPDRDNGDVASFCEIAADSDEPDQLIDLRDIIINQQWMMPARLLRRLYADHPSQLMVKRVIQDAMSPTIDASDYVFISTSPEARRISGTRGIYILNDGVTILFRRVEPILHGDEKVYSLIGDNPAVKPRVVHPDRCVILGRIVAVMKFFR